LESESERAMTRGLGFGDLAAEALRRETRLDRIGELLNWGPIAYRLEKLCRKDQGRPPFPPVVMFRALLLAQWYGLSDRELEESLCDRLSFRRFVGLRLEDATPDHTTLCRFRDRLCEVGLEKKLLDIINAQLERKGFMLKKGMLIDATIVESASRPPPVGDSGEDRLDPDAAFLKREGRSGRNYGYKAHVASDEGTLLIRAAVLTPANVNETEVADELITACKDARAVYADRAYDSHARRAFLAELGLKNGIMQRGNKHHSPSQEMLAHNAACSRVRSAVETVFAVLKRNYDFRRMRYLGCVKNQLHLTLLAICFNLRRALALGPPARSLSAA
jgi:transposase, IS5 family